MARANCKAPSFALIVVVVALLAAGSSASADEAPTFADRVDETTDEATRNMAFFFSPLAMAAGVFGAEADFALAKRLAIALEGDVYGLGGTSSPATALGIGLPFYPLRCVFRGLYVEPRFVFARRANESPLEIDWRSDVVGLGGTAGWQWTWDYGLSVRLGAGAMDYVGGGGSAGGGPSLAIAGENAVLVVDASLGWAF